MPKETPVTRQGVSWPDLLIISVLAACVLVVSIIFAVIAYLHKHTLDAWPTVGMALGFLTLLGVELEHQERPGNR